MKNHVAICHGWGGGGILRYEHICARTSTENVGGLIRKGGVYAGRYGNVEPRLQIKCLEDIPSGPMSSMVMRIEITYGLTSSGEAVWGLMHRM